MTCLCAIISLVDGHVLVWLRWLVSLVFQCGAMLTRSRVKQSVHLLETKRPVNKDAVFSSALPKIVALESEAPLKPATWLTSDKRVVFGFRVGGFASPVIISV